MARKKTAPKAKKQRAARRQGPAAAAKADKKKTARGRPGGKRPGEDERIACRRSRAITARIQGGTYREIATRNECSVGTAFEDVAAELAGVCKATRLEAEQLRALDLERADLALRGLKSAVMKGDPASCRAWVRTLEYRAKLLGLIKPTHVRPDDEPEEAELSEREVAERVAALVEFARTPNRGEKSQKIH